MLDPQITCHRSPSRISRTPSTVSRDAPLSQHLAESVITLSLGDSRRGRIVGRDLLDERVLLRGDLVRRVLGVARDAEEGRVADATEAALL